LRFICLELEFKSEDFSRVLVETNPIVVFGHLIIQTNLLVVVHPIGKDAPHIGLDVGLGLGGRITSSQSDNVEVAPLGRTQERWRLDTADGRDSRVSVNRGEFEHLLIATHKRAVI
jgi:hypothetical protein